MVLNKRNQKRNFLHEKDIENLQLMTFVFVVLTLNLIRSIDDNLQLLRFAILQNINVTPLCFLNNVYVKKSIMSNPFCKDSRPCKHANHDLFYMMYMVVYFLPIIYHKRLLT